MYIKLQSKDIILKLLPKGATIYELQTKNKNGIFKNIVLTHKNIEQYNVNNEGYFGATCGRFAGRIEKGSFTIGKTLYELTKNENQNTTLHGGNKSLSNVLWDYTITEKENKSICMFEYTSKDLEEGFPGNVKLKVEYILENNTLTINYYGTTDKKTYLNLTNHSYFNLSDEDDRIYNHYLKLNADYFLDLNENLVPKNIISVQNTDFDYRTLRQIGNLKEQKDINIKDSLGINHPFKLKEDNIDYDLFLEDKKSGRTLKIKTTYPFIVLYTYNYPTNTELLNRANKKHSAIAIEPQYPPNAVNDNRFNLKLTDIENPYFHNITYIFS
ncbi:MAG: aldose epimerase family protein [Lachnospirales bacterium]